MQKSTVSLWLSALLISGCGGMSSSPTGTTSGSASQSAGATLNAGDFSVAKAEALAQAVVGGGATDFVLDDTTTASTDLGVPRQSNNSVARNAVAQLVALGVGQLGVFVTGEAGSLPGSAARIGNQDASRTINSPLGGSVDVNVQGPVATATFHEFRTARATLNGSCVLTLTAGRLSGGNYQGAVAFTALTVTTQSGAYTLDGRASFSRALSLNSGVFALDTSWIADLAIRDSGGGTRTFRNFSTATNLTLEAGTLTATQRYSGGLTLENVQGISGAFEISTPTAMLFSGSPQAFQLVAGQMLVAGSQGTLRLTVTGPDQIEIALISTGGIITVVRTQSWTGLGGSNSAN